MIGCNSDVRGASSTLRVCSTKAREQNREGRVRETGAGAELLRQLCVEQVRSYMEAFYELVALSRALELSERLGPGGLLSKAPVLE